MTGGTPVLRIGTRGSALEANILAEIGGREKQRTL